MERLSGMGGRDYLQEENIGRAQMRFRDPDNAEDFERRFRT